MAALYAVYHGPEGLKTIAHRVNGLASVFAAGAAKLGHTVPSAPFFDTVSVTVKDGDADKYVALALNEKVRGSWRRGVVAFWRRKEVGGVEGRGAGIPCNVGGRRVGVVWRLWYVARAGRAVTKQTHQTYFGTTNSMVAINYNCRAQTRSSCQHAPCHVI